jgi:hypothetical protein
MGIIGLMSGPISKSFNRGGKAVANESKYPFIVEMPVSPRMDWTPN